MDEYTVHQTRWRQWAETLRDELREWLNANGYGTGMQPATDFMDQLEIPYRVWQGIVSPTKPNISISNMEVYARLFVRTCLASADPRTIPPMPKKLPGNRGFTTVEVAWSEEQWQRWVDSNTAETHPTPTAQTTPTYVPTTPLSEAAATFAHALATAVAQQLQQPQLTNPSDAGIIAAFVTLIENVASSSVPDQQRFYDQHGAEIGPILVLLDALLQDTATARIQALKRALQGGLSL